MRHESKSKEPVCAREYDCVRGLGGQIVGRGQQRTVHSLMLAWVNDRVWMIGALRATPLITSVRDEEGYGHQQGQFRGLGIEQS